MSLKFVPKGQINNFPVPGRRQAIIRSNDDYINEQFMCHATSMNQKCTLKVKNIMFEVIVIYKNEFYASFCPIQKTYIENGLIT